MMQDKKHLEYRVTEWDSPAKTKIIRKELTKRGSVMISERDARTNNLQTSATGLFYELAEVPKETGNDTKQEKVKAPDEQKQEKVKAEKKGGRKPKTEIETNQ